MLKFFRKHARGWFMLVFMGIIIFVFVLYLQGKTDVFHHFVKNKKASLVEIYKPQTRKFPYISRRNAGF